LVKFNDLTEQKFGRWTVIKRVESDKWGHSMWLCKCDCNGENSEKIVCGDRLIRGVSKSCGCLIKEINILKNKQNKKYNTYDLSGEYGIGYTSKGEEFYFDLEDYDKIKDYCWVNNGNGYIRSTKINNKRIYIHRLVTNCPSKMDIDHINHNIIDNRKSNLRICEHQKNMCNYTKPKNNTSGVKGISWDKYNNKWKAEIMENRKKISIGNFNKFEDAVKARKEAEEKYYGEYNYKED